MSAKSQDSNRGIAKFISRFPIATVVCIYLFSCIIAGVFAPCVFNFIQDLYYKYDISVLQKLSSRGLGIVFERIRLFAVILSLPLLYKVIKSLKIGDEIFAQNTTKRKSFLFISHAFLGILLIVAVYFLYNVNKFFSKESYEISFSFGLIKCFGFFLRALFIACIEEYIFRNLLVRLLFNKYSRGISVILSALMFAYLHFRVQPSVCEISSDATLMDGLIHASLSIFVVWKYIDFTKFFVLFLLGTLLAQMVFWRKSLIPAIGFHCGIVFILFVIRATFIDGLSLSATVEIFNSYIVIVLLILMNFLYVFRKI